MIKKRSLATTSIALLAVAALTGCSTGGSGDAGSGSDAGGATEVRVLVNITPNLTEEWWNTLVKPFEDANPDIDVIIQSPGADGVQKALPRLLASGDAPDIVQSLAPTPELAQEFVDLSSYDWAANGPLAEQYAIDGKQYMAGVGIQLQSLWFYNKTAFEEAGITETPKDLDEFTADLAKLKDAGWTPIQTGGDWMSQMSYQALALPSVVADNDDWFQKMSSGDLTFSKTAGAYTEMYADWVAKGYLNSDALGIKYPDAEQSFLAGKSALYPMGSWFAAAEANADNPPSIGVFAGPADASVKNPAMGANIASPYSILKSSDHQEAALKVVEYLATDKAAVVDQLQVDGNYRDGYEYEMNDLATELLLIVADTPASSYTPTGNGYGERTMPAGYADELNTQVQALLGGTSAADVNSALDSWFVANAQ
ncbi:MAG: ABC transporter substrate-binding protein [Microbacterium sp.]|jgi:multiple sugar transport system substrate-binding protein/raffinose/stachyose/melibiose transport system substrate-binding protein|nr:ABC transporter substrate-binding protein [Microbacterium sp.]